MLSHVIQWNMPLVTCISVCVVYTFAHKYKRHVTYIPLISRVRGPYGKLWTEFFSSFYGPSAKHAGHENNERKNEDP